jgi:hypothetical protein
MSSNIPKAIGFVVFLILLDIVVNFVLNVLANKVSDLIIFSSSYIPVTLLVLIVLAIVSGVMLEYRGQWSNIQIPNLFQILLSRVFTIFISAIVIGGFTAYICSILIPSGHLTFGDLVWWAGIFKEDGGLAIGPWNYEIVGFFVGLFTIYLVNNKKRNITLILTYSIGLASSLAIAFFLLYPGFDEILSVNLIIWNLTFIVAALLMQKEVSQQTKDILRLISKFVFQPR